MPTSEELMAQRRAKHEARLALRRATRTPLKQLNPTRRQAILERDGWTCHICTLPIDRAAAWPAPESGTVDHVVPLARGGSNDDANLAAAHAYCNNVKQDRLTA